MEEENQTEQQPKVGESPNLKPKQTEETNSGSEEPKPPKKPPPPQQQPSEEEEEEPPPVAPPEEVPETFQEKFRFYRSAFFILLATFSATAFIFCVPFILDPALSTVLADFVGPVTCTTIESKEVDDKMACANWTSCREGCTKEFFKCDQVWVRYVVSDCNETIDNSTLSRENGYNLSFPVHPCVRHAKLLINVKGCGYPPTIQCWKFWQDFGNISAHFPCFYSKENDELAITDGKSIDDAMSDILTSFFVPLFLFAASMVYISVSYCACCRRGLNLDKDESMHSMKSQAGGQSITSQNTNSSHKSANNTNDSEKTNKGSPTDMPNSVVVA